MAKQKKTNRLQKQAGKAKKRGKRLLILLAILIVLWILTLVFAPAAQPSSAYVQDLELPLYQKGELVVRHPGYTLLYDEEHEQARWVAYHLSREELYGSHDRGDDFRADPSIPTGSAALDDYRSSGYDRGHLIPAADLSWSQEAMSASFFLSNMSPQAGTFNRGIWSKLEATVRNFADTEGAVYVVTGPVLTDGPYKTIGKNQVSVPNAYYKVVLDYQEPEYKAIGFLLPNEGSKKDLQAFAVRVDEVEEVTGIDFFHRLKDREEDVLEASYDVSLWDFSTFSASAKDREAFQEGNLPAKTGEKPSGIYSIAKGTLSTILSVVKKESVNIIELFIPKATLREAAPFLY
ncbi:MAG: DNA/RNA non-specific endonuclease [Sphaerochaeta sp.]|jgi:endonuclease G|uniref:DNA/RNA non-specific endonuclease n=1 Tax=Sphaerochaeta sp. TaxID=1972642 RepID=UPI002A35CF72|nr:DNA/RNA non-specific endonuclease [Sphaerochaeta sp.]MDX9824193.1 DNA/RNA non-specific endonuclease [Sphaerochaeta sp.]